MTGQTKRPAYFDAIRRKAAERWDQLERDPDLAAPWHQLFRQVQSPRHVVSELLQNADDAGAREANVRVEDGVFIFEHNGEDFRPEHFESLCRFGYSNKRNLHTIGFRGIGFKSTFSLGDRVEVHTPSLSVRFDRRRFTEPVWVTRESRADKRTCFRVAISDPHRRLELEKNLNEWQQSPLSLLFFKNIRRLCISDEQVQWKHCGRGPGRNSEWVSLDGREAEKFLLIRSAAVPFPEDALAEIRDERTVDPEQATQFPPCSIEIVLGAKGGLFVVLPTGVMTELPFACNAPFMQDPARLKIKDPDTSPTNRWLLGRAGELAAATMLAWLEDEHAPAEERAAAYGLLPDVGPLDGTVGRSCGNLVEHEFGTALGDKPVLLTQDGALAARGQSTALPRAVVDIWSARDAADFFDELRRPALSGSVVPTDLEKLLHWGWVEKISKATVLNILQTKRLPTPRSWAQLAKLWAYVAPEVNAAFHQHVTSKAVRIVPVQGKEVMYSAAEVVRLGEKKLLESDADWEFLGAHVLVVDHGWLAFVSEQRRASEEEWTLAAGTGLRSAATALAAANAMHAVLQKFGLEAATDVSKVIDVIAKPFFAQQRSALSIADCTKLTHILAKLGAATGEHFYYVTRDSQLRAPKDGVLYDDDRTLEELLPAEQRNSHLLHAAYTEAFHSCSREEWAQWVGSGKAHLRAFPAIAERETKIVETASRGRSKVEALLLSRGHDAPLAYPYKGGSFIVEDWDFDERYWKHWQALAKEDARVWGMLLERILAQPENQWSVAMRASAHQVASTNARRALTSQPLTPKWILRFRELACLRDTRGTYERPAELLRRTPETESFLDVEPFVHSTLDREGTRRLLDLLGVRTRPTGPDRLLAIVRGLADAENALGHEVERWYRRLDQMAHTCSTAELQTVKNAFLTERLILTDKGVWTTTIGVTLSADEDVAPGAAVIRASVADLTLWRKLDVAERPTADRAIAWLKELPSGQRLVAADAQRVKALLARHPHRVWDECGHWMNLVGEWVAVESLCYVLTMQSLAPWSHLHDWLKQKTADLQRLPEEITGTAPFRTLPTLASRIEDRFRRDPIAASDLERVIWMTTLGAELGRIELEDDAQTTRIREVARDLASTEVQRSPSIEIIPYVDGTPAGTPRRAEVIWQNRVLHLSSELTKAKLAKRIPEEIAKAFNRADIKAALDYGFERSADDIRAYLAENFRLAPSVEPTSANGEHVPPSIGPETLDSSAVESRGAGTTTDAPPSQGLPDTPPVNDAPASDPQARGADRLMIEPTQPPPDRPPPPPKPTARPNLIERFAVANGFRRRAEGGFVHPDGSSITRSDGGRFTWERLDPSGNSLRSYLPFEHCLQREPLELDAVVWDLLEKAQDAYALILIKPGGEPYELAGARLCRLRQKGKLTLYPAAYRLALGGK